LSAVEDFTNKVNSNYMVQFCQIYMIKLSQLRKKKMSFLCRFSKRVC